MRHHRARRGQQGGGQLLVLAVLLLGLAGLGGWNYHRNWQAEQAEQGQRAFAGYADADLEQLAAAYRQEVEARQAAYDRARTARTPVRKSGHVSDGIREFERVQRRAQRSRELGAEVAEREARLRDIEKELAYRAELRSGLRLHLKRLTGF